MCPCDHSRVGVFYLYSSASQDARTHAQPSKKTLNFVAAGEGCLLLKLGVPPAQWPHLERIYPEVSWRVQKCLVFQGADIVWCLLFVTVVQHTRRHQDWNGDNRVHACAFTKCLHYPWQCGCDYCTFDDKDKND